MQNGMLCELPDGFVEGALKVLRNTFPDKPKNEADKINMELHNITDIEALIAQHVTKNYAIVTINQPYRTWNVVRRLESHMRKEHGLGPTFKSLSRDIVFPGSMARVKIVSKNKFIIVRDNVII